jgi:competence protein ComEA
MKYFSVSQQWVLFVVALLLLGILTFKFYYYPPSTPSGEPVKEVVVEVLGEVRQPGIYLFHNPPNLKEAIERAGGLKEAAQFDTIFSSTILETGTLLTVTREPSQIPPTPPLSKGGQRGIKQDDIKIRIGRMAANKLLVFSLPLDLNHVSAEDLCLIPGIGESLAQEMIAYRERRKGFRAVEELKNVRGIGGKKYETFKKFLAVKN